MAPEKQAYNRWKRMRFKQNKVWVAVDQADHPQMEDGKVLIKYQLNQPHEYRVNASSVRALDGPGEVVQRQQPAQNPAKAGSGETPEAPAPRFASGNPDDIDCANTICIYTDGACSGNPGPAGIGIVMIHKDRRKEISRHIGTGTNNIAELEAIRTGLAAVRDKRHPAAVFTDSQYAFGLLTKGWKARQNTALVAQIRKLAAEFEDLRFVKLRGHIGHKENERADRLAVSAIQNRA